MKLKQYLNESYPEYPEYRKAQIWKGILYRAIDSKSKVSALGTGMYFTPSKESAELYGKKIKKYQTKPIKVLGVGSLEYEKIKAYVNSDEGFDKWFDEHSTSQMIRMEAEDRGFDAIYQDSIFGIVIFNKRNVKEIK